VWGRRRGLTKSSVSRAKDLGPIPAQHGPVPNPITQLELPGPVVGHERFAFQRRDLSHVQGGVVFAEERRCTGGLQCEELLAVLETQTGRITSNWLCRIDDLFAPQGNWLPADQQPEPGIGTLGRGDG
jgi:hypothetical protein